MEEKSEFDDFLQNKDKYILKIRNEKIYECRNEIYFFSIMCGIQIKYFVINSSKCYKNKKNEVNYFSPLIYKKGNGETDEELLRIKKIICGINPDSKEEVKFEDFEIKKVISGKTDKALDSRQRRSKWNLFTLYIVEKKLEKLYDYYKVVKNNNTLKDNKKVDYSKLMECNKLSSIIHR